MFEKVFRLHRAIIRNAFIAYRIFYTQSNYSPLTLLYHQDKYEYWDFGVIIEMQQKSMGILFVQ